MSERVDVQQLRETVLRGMGPTINASGGSSSEIQWRRDKALRALDALLARLDALEEVADAAEQFLAGWAPDRWDMDHDAQVLIAKLARLREGKA